MKNLQPMRHRPRTITTRHYLVGLLTLVSLLVASPALAGKLHKAAEKGNIAKVERLIAKGANVNAKSKNGLTPLHGAARQGHLTIVELLIASGANVNAKDKVGATPLHEPADTGNKAVAELLIAKGANVDARTKIGRTPLHWAVYRAHKIIAELLIASGANINAQAKDGFTPLHRAANQGYTAVVELLIAKGADVNAKDKDGKTPLRLATDRGHKDLARLLKQHGADQPVAMKRAPPAQATGGFKTYTGHQHQFLIDLPPGWFAYDQIGAATGTKGPTGPVTFSPVNITEMGFNDAIHTIANIAIGAIPSFFVDRHPKEKKMSCRYFAKEEVKEVLKILKRAPMFGSDRKVLKALEAQPVTIGGCKGYRIRGETQLPNGTIYVNDVHALSDGKILYLFSLKNIKTYYESNLGFYEKAISTVQLSP